MDLPALSSALSSPSLSAVSLSSGVRQVGDVGAMVDLPEGDLPVALYRELRRLWPKSEPVPGWASVLVSEPGVSARAMVERLRTVLATWDPEELSAPARQMAVTPEQEPLTIPVVYDGEDLDDVAVATGLTPAEVIAAHTAPTYSVALLGFSRGFPYFRGLDARLRMPRLASPRVRVPAGSVGIALDQTGIYPMSSPGGWRLLGHTEAVLFDPTADPPSALEPGTRVRFVDASPFTGEPPPS